MDLAVRFRRYVDRVGWFFVVGQFLIYVFVFFVLWKIGRVLFRVVLRWL
jgi:hypothetical protein